jgi:two-component system chemotaxis response regulator CheB
MVKRDIIVIGASAGSMEMLLAIIAGLPENLPVTILVVLHIPANSPSRLKDILGRVSSLPVIAPEDGDPIVSGCIYVPTPDRHLLVENDRIRVTRGPKENRARPAVDALFRSAAYSFGQRVIGIVLSGNLDDGTAGLWAIKDRGGIAIVQSPEEALFPSMPKSALEHVDVDYILPSSDIPATIVRFVQEPIMATERDQNSNAANSLSTEIKTAMGEDPIVAGTFDLGAVSLLTCPECHGVLIEIKEGSLVRFRCHTGHAFSSQALFGQTNQAIDKHIWNALRAIDEKITLLRTMEKQAKTESNSARLNEYNEHISQSEKLRLLLRAMVTSAVTSA